MGVLPDSPPTMKESSPSRLTVRASWVLGLVNASRPDDPKLVSTDKLDVNLDTCADPALKLLRELNTNTRPWLSTATDIALESLPPAGTETVCRTLPESLSSLIYP
jgi:hypothetical protein